MKKLLAWWKRHRIARLEGALNKRRTQRITELEAQIEQLQAELKDERETTRHLEMTLKQQALVIERGNALLAMGVSKHDINKPNDRPSED